MSTFELLLLLSLELELELIRRFCGSSSYRDCDNYHRVGSVNSESFIFGSEFVLYSQEILESDPNMKLLLFTERTNNNHFFLQMML